MPSFQNLDTTLLHAAGLNRHAVFNLDQLPADVTAAVQAACQAGAAYRQLILIGHAGRQLWDAVQASGIASPHRIDDFSTQTVTQWFATAQAHNQYHILFPGPHLIGLQRLGQLAGWHHATPFMVGIDQEWGTWYAYRAVVLADTAFAPTLPVVSAHPCTSCAHKICISSCPAGALAGGQFDLAKCLGYRKQAGSDCKATCLARISCPVGSEHRYSASQIHRTYTLSMQMIERDY